MPVPRPEQVGLYYVLKDHEFDTASIRVIRMDEGGEAVHRHVHQASAQVYLCLQGFVVVDRGGEHIRLSPWEACEVPVGVPHGVRPEGDDAVVANISVPPLQVGDQLPVTEGA